MTCPICGDRMEFVPYTDGTGGYFMWVCYVCELRRLGELEDKCS